MAEQHPTPSAPTTADWLSRPLWGQLDWEKTIYLIILIVAIVSRFWALGDRAVSHDESLHTQYAYQYYNGDGYVHTPLMHGPFLFHITALSYWLFGHNDFTARIPVAILGIVVIFMPYFVRDWIGKRGALVASFLLLISPYITYYSRYIRHDIFAIITALIIFTATWHYLRDGWHKGENSLYWFAFGLGWLFTTKEVSFLYVAIFGSFLVYRLLLQMVYEPWFKPGLRQLVVPLAIIGVGVLLVGGGLVGKSSLERSLEATLTATPTDQSQFAVDPTNPALHTDTAAGIAGVGAMRWLQVAGLVTLSMGLFLVASTWRTHLQDYPEFDLIILYATLVLPSVTPLLVFMVGWNPLDYNIGTCFIAGQEGMGAFAIFWAKLFDGQCWATFLQSGAVRTGLFALPIIAVSVAVGVWWNGRVWFIAAAIFHILFTLLHTALFTNPGGWASGTIGALGYWLEQHEVQRGSQPWFYYLFVTTFYEFLPIIFTLLGARLWAQKARIHQITSYWFWFLFVALIGYSYANWVANRQVMAVFGDEISRTSGIITAAIILTVGLAYWLFAMRGRDKRTSPQFSTLAELVKNESLIGMPFFLFWWTVLSFVIYSIAGEKMPWLSTHMVIPMALMVGWYFNEQLRDVTWAELTNQRALVYMGLTAVFILSAVLALAPLWLGQVQSGQQTAALRGTGRFLGGLLVLGGLGYLLWQQRQGLDTAVRQRAWLFSTFALLALLTMRFTYMANWPNGDLATEYLVYAHGAPATKQEILPQLEQLSVRLNGDLTMEVIYDNESSWPYTWYLRNFTNRRYVGETFTPDIGNAPALLIGNNNWSKVEPYLRDNYDYQTYTYLWWPMEEYRQFGWEALLGNPDLLSKSTWESQGYAPAPHEIRRGLGNAEVRHALWDIFFYRDYTQYGQTFDRTFNLGAWPLRDEVRLYIRKDVKANLWDYGVAATAVVVPEDPYQDKAFTLQPEAVIGQGELSKPRNAAVGADGRLYVADAGNHRIAIFEDGQLVQSFGTNGDQTGQFNEPWGIAVDDQAIYVADTWNHRVQIFSLTGEFITAFGQSGTIGADQATGGGGVFFGPRAIVLLPNNQLAVTDTGNHRIQIFDRAGNFVQAVGGLGALSGQFYEPVGLAVGPLGTLYVADTWNERIQELAPTLNFGVFEWSVNAWRSQSIENKPYLAADALGRVYATDPEGYRVLMFGADGSYLGRFGEYSPTSTGFGLPNGIAVDDANRIYVVDSANGTVLRFANPLGQ
jgi:DNA-binding beta-propeller fold protein YncE